MGDKEYDYIFNNDEFDNFTVNTSDLTVSGYDFSNLTAPTIELDELDGLEYNVKDPIEERLSAIEDRLAILKPDPEKLEKWEALREAYEHYKSLEALIGNTEPDNDC